MSYVERGLVFDCAGESLVGVVAVPERPEKTGVVIIVGGPQYRIGSHRQFVLLARHFAANGFACLRFDNRSMGDATGETRDFEDIDEDLAAAVTALVTAVPDVTRIVLLGLCGGASAACVYAPRDPRVKALFLLNPWVRTAESHAKAYIKHYYVDRLRDPAFWKKLLAGKVSVVGAVSGFVRTARRAAFGGAKAPEKPEVSGAASTLMEQMLDGLELSGCRSVVVLSGRDYVARECDEVLIPHPRFQRLAAASQANVVRVNDADHTFTSPELHQLLEQLAADFVRSVHVEEMDGSRP